MQLYMTPHSTFCRRVRIALHEKGLRAEEVQAGAEVRASPAFRALNPYGRIPVLLDGSLVLYESTAILEYLEALRPDPPLVPSAAGARARVAMHVKLCDLEFTPHAVRIQRPKRLEPEERWDRSAMAQAREPIASHYAKLERELEGRDYLVGNDFTWADLVYVPFLHFHPLLEIELPTRIAAWWQRLSQRDSVRATVPAM